MVSKVIDAIIQSEVTVAIMSSNNDLGLHCCKQEGGSTGVFMPGEQGTGQEAGGAKHLELGPPESACWENACVVKPPWWQGRSWGACGETFGAFPMVCRPRRWPSTLVGQASGRQSREWSAPGGLIRDCFQPSEGRPGGLIYGEQALRAKPQSKARRRRQRPGEKDPR
jgi:hypothetical protein